MTEAEQLQLERLRLQVEREKERARKQRKQDRADTVAMIISGAVAIISAIMPLLLFIFLAGRH